MYRRQTLRRILLASTTISAGALAVLFLLSGFYLLPCFESESA
jgi:hypothetical protein